MMTTLASTRPSPDAIVDGPPGLGRDGTSSAIAMGTPAEPPVSPEKSMAKPPKGSPDFDPSVGFDPLVESVMGWMVARRRYSRGVWSEGVELGDHVAGEDLDPAWIGHVPETEDDMLGARVREVAE